MKYLFSLFLFTWIYTPLAYALDSDGSTTSGLIDPESINPTTRLLSYKIPAENIVISSYGGAHPSHFKVTLCKTCQPIIYRLNKNALLEDFGYEFNIDKLTNRFTKKEFQYVGLGINRDRGEITRISLNPVNKELEERPKLENPL